MAQITAAGNFDFGENRRIHATYADRSYQPQSSDTFSL
jgi:hypothetical protein